MKIDYVHFLPETKIELVPKKRSLGEVNCLIKPADITGETHYMWCRHPLKVGPNAVIMCVPPQKFGAVWQVVKILPPQEFITTRDATYTESAMLRLSEDYWKGFTRLDPKFAARVAPSFVESPATFDELFRQISVPLARNFKRDFTVILMWETWRQDLGMINMTYDLAAESLKKQFDISGEIVRKLGKKYKLPRWRNDEAGNF